MIFFAELYSGWRQRWWHEGWQKWIYETYVGTLINICKKYVACIYSGVLQILLYSISI